MLKWALLWKPKRIRETTLLLGCCCFSHILSMFSFLFSFFLFSFLFGLLFFVAGWKNWSVVSSFLYKNVDIVYTYTGQGLPGINAWVLCSPAHRPARQQGSCMGCQGVNSMVYHVRSSAELFIITWLLPLYSQNKLYVRCNGKKWTCHTVSVSLWVSVCAESKEKKKGEKGAEERSVHKSGAQHCCWCHLVMHRLTLAACYYLEK